MVSVAEGERLSWSIDGPVTSDKTLNWAVSLSRHRHMESEQAFARRHIMLLADPDDGETEPHQESIPEVRLEPRIACPGAAIKVRKQGLTSTVAHLE